MNTHPPTAEDTSPEGTAFPTQLHDQFLEPRSIPANWDTSEMLSQTMNHGRSKPAHPAEPSLEIDPAGAAETGEQLSLAERVHEPFPESIIFPIYWDMS